jgi:hypothetical protein
MPNLVYIKPETAHTWTDTGGDDALDLGGLAADAVRAGDHWDLGTSARSEWYQWHLIIDGFDTAPVVGETVDAYLAFSQDATAATLDGDLGLTDAASSTVVLPNLQYLGSAVVQTITAANELVTSGIVRIGARGVSPVIHNNTADALLSAADAHKFILIPIPPEIQ